MICLFASPFRRAATNATEDVAKLTRTQIGARWFRSPMLTCGLRNSESPTSDNLNSQEATKPDAPDMGLGGAELSCPGSSVGSRLSEEGSMSSTHRSLADDAINCVLSCLHFECRSIGNVPLGRQISSSLSISPAGHITIEIAQRWELQPHC